MHKLYEISDGNYRYFTGSITNIVCSSSRANIHTIKYEDGDVEDLTTEQLEEVLRDWEKSQAMQAETKDKYTKKVCAYIV